MTCPICEHPQRTAIENAVLSCSSDHDSETLQDIADEYNISLNALKVHMVMHASLGFVNRQEDDQPVDTLARKCKVREADILSEVANEYLVTLKNLGRRINKHLSSDSEEVQAEKLITKPIADMYIGIGGEIRATVKTISELDQALHGPKTGANDGIAALAAMIGQSRQMAADQGDHE